MSKKTQYRDEPLGAIRRVPDFLPSPEELALKLVGWVERSQTQLGGGGGARVSMAMLGYASLTQPTGLFGVARSAPRGSAP